MSLFKNIFIFIPVLFLVSSCGGEGSSANTTLQTTGPVAGTLNRTAWTMSSGESKDYEKQNGTKVLDIELTDSADFKACDPYSRLSFKRRSVSISVPIQIGTTDVGGDIGAVAFVYPVENTTYIMVADGGKVTITSLTDKLVVGTIEAKDSNGNSVSGTFSVPRCSARK